MRKSLLIITILLISSINLFSQAQLVDSFVGENTNDYFGHSVSNAGDVNNDGIDDVIVGAWYYSTITGRAYIYYGGSSMNSTADVTMTGEGTYNYFGWSVAAAGDVNNDGIGDVIVGALGYNSNTGRAYIYYGSNGGIDNTVDVTMDGEGEDDAFGGSVSTAGDVNNDGIDDIIVGAYLYNSFDGQAYIYYGDNVGNGGIDNIADVTMSGGTTGAAGEYFGWSVSTAGDVNNDGIDDVIIGAERYSSWTGRAYIYYGGNGMDNSLDVTIEEGSGYNLGCSVSNAGDVNNDGYDDVIVGALGYNSSQGLANIYYGGNGAFDNIADITLQGELGGNYFGKSVSAAGNINNDNYDDVIVGAYGYSSSTGRAYIYYGGNSMDATADITITGENTDDRFGYSVSYAGDVNNDNYDDVIVGAYYHNSKTGKSYVYSDPGAPLPVELTAFTAKVNDNSVTLNWTTATEVNNYGFEVQRALAKLGSNTELSRSAEGWQTLGFIEGHGNSNSQRDYSYVDTSTPLSASYRLKQIDVDGSFEYSDIVTIEVSTPMEFKLAQNHPNPFNPTTRIDFSIPNTLMVSIKVYNSLGEEIAELANRSFSSGNHSVDFDGSNLSSGMYFYTLHADGFSKTMKMMLLK